MRRGQARCLVTLQEATDTRNARGQTLPKTWADISTNPTQWVYFKNASGSEVLRAEAMEGRLVHVCETRFRSDITPKMRFTYDGRTFNITSVRNVEERREMLELTVTEVI